MSHVKTSNVKEYVFKNFSILELLGEVGEYFSKKPLKEEIEKKMEDMVVTYDHELSVYVATVYIIDL